MTDERMKEFEDYLKFNARIIMIQAIIGDYDMYFVMLGKDTSDLNMIKNDIRKKFSELIDDWKEVVVAKILKYEEYQF